jgi:hypothetical protein
MARSFTEDEVRYRIAEAVASLKARTAELESEIVRLKKNSTTSSKPPPSDIVKPPRPVEADGKRRKRRSGGQPHHPRHSRPLFPPEEVDATWLYKWTMVLARWKSLKQFRVLQQFELVQMPHHVIERRTDCMRTGDRPVVAGAATEHARVAGIWAVEA